MSEAREQSYYEIALTNRQVMSIFIVLLVCLLASFVSGVWIGRQGAGVRVQTAAAQRIEGESGAGETPVGEMDFFKRGAGDPAAAQPDPPAPATPPVAAAEPAPDREPPAARPPASEPEADTRTPAPAPARNPTPAPPAVEPQADAQFLFVQVFSGVDREQAQTIVQQLKDGGYAAFLSSVEVENRLMHRVRIGPYSQREEAEGVAGQVQRRFKLSTWITP